MRSQRKPLGDLAQDLAVHPETGLQRDARPYWGTKIKKQRTRKSSRNWRSSKFSFRFTRSTCFLILLLYTLWSGDLQGNTSKHMYILHLVFILFKLWRVNTGLSTWTQFKDDSFLVADNWLNHSPFQDRLWFPWKLFKWRKQFGISAYL